VPGPEAPVEPVAPGSSINSSASERPLLKTRLVTIVLFNATVMLATGTEEPFAATLPPVQVITMSPSNSA